MSGKRKSMSNSYQHHGRTSDSHDTKPRKDLTGPTIKKAKRIAKVADAPNQVTSLHALRNLVKDSTSIPLGPTSDLPTPGNNQVAPPASKATIIKKVTIVRPPQRRKTPVNPLLLGKHTSSTSAPGPRQVVVLGSDGGGEDPIGPLRQLPLQEKTQLQLEMEKKLQGAQFRFLNEELYTTTSDHAFRLMQESPHLLALYHEGFRTQVEKWPVNPVDMIIQWIQHAHKGKRIADLGCGDAKIAQVLGGTIEAHTAHRQIPGEAASNDTVVASVGHNIVYSFDLAAVNQHVTACDIKATPLAPQSVDIAVFSLALMGTNFLSFIQEAFRILKKSGFLKIAEVRSRFDEHLGGIERFIAAVESVGFKHTKTDKKNKMFVLFDFIRLDAPHGRVKDFTLKPCIYKRR